MRIYRLNRLLVFAVMFLLLSVSWVWAELTINIVAVNPSETSRKINIKYYLPEELSPEDLADTGVLKVDYNVDQGAYYVHEEVVFQPKESKTFKVKVKDVWRIEKEEIDVIKAQLDGNVELLKDKENFDVIKRARDKLVEKLDYILAQQESYSGNIGRRIEEYRAYVDMLAEIKKEAYSLKNLQFGADAVDEIDQKKTVSLNVEVTNPSGNSERMIQHKHYLPDEIRAQDIVETAGFEVRFDEKEGKSYLTKEENFKAGESKQYKIVMKDIWQMPGAKLDGVQQRAQIAMDEIKETVYEDTGAFLFNAINDRLEQINKSQQEKQPTIKKHIGMFRVNQGRYKKVEEDLDKIEELMAIIKAKRLEELEQGRVKNVLQRLRSLRGLAALAEAIFKRRISLTTTWKIILGTVAFVAFFTALHFFIWARRSGVVGEERGVKPGEGIEEVPKPGT